MEGGVAVGRGGIRMSHVLQQQLHDLCFPQTGCNVERGLVLLKMTQWKKDELQLVLNKEELCEVSLKITAVSPVPWRPRSRRSSADI